MNSRLRFRVVAALLAATLILGASRARAGTPFTVSIDRPDRTLDVASFTTFEVHVVSTAADTIRVRAIRVVNDLPDTSWYASICSITTCYPPEIDTTELESAAPGEMTGFTIHVMTGSRYGDTATISLRIDTGDGSDAVTRTVTVATARPPVQLFRVEPVDLAKSVTVGETAEFLIWAYNQASDTLTLSVERVEDYFSGANWQSQLCVEETCYASSVDRPPSITLDNDRATFFRLRVRAGSVGQARIVLRFNTERGTEPIEKRFSVEAGVSAAELDPRTHIGVSSAHPNPTSGMTVIELPAGVTAPLRVDVAGVDGRVMPDRPFVRTDDAGRTSLRIDLGDLAAGVYAIRVIGATTVRIVHVVVHR
jgi:hypothetical protein